jgi:hypothetical protein
MAAWPASRPAAAASQPCSPTQPDRAPAAPGSAAHGYRGGAWCDAGHAVIPHA